MSDAQIPLDVKKEMEVEWERIEASEGEGLEVDGPPSPTGYGETSIEIPEAFAAYPELTGKRGSKSFAFFKSFDWPTDLQDIALSLGNPISETSRFLSNQRAGYDANGRLSRDAEEIWVPSLREALPNENEWTNPFLLGTPAANRRLYLIRRVLETHVHRLKNKYQGMHSNSRS